MKKINIKTKLNRKIQWPKAIYYAFEKTNKICKPLARLMKKEKRVQIRNKSKI